MSNIYEKVTNNFFLVHTFGNEDDFARMVIPDESETQNAPGRNAQLRRHRHSCWLLRGEINPVRRPGLPRVKGVKGVRPKKGLQKTLKAECVPVPRWQVPPTPPAHRPRLTIHNPVTMTAKRKRKSQMLFSVNLMTFMCAETRDQAFKMATGLPIQFCLDARMFRCSVVTVCTALTAVWRPLRCVCHCLPWPGQLA